MGEVHGPGLQVRADPAVLSGANRDVPAATELVANLADCRLRSAAHPVAVWSFLHFRLCRSSACVAASGSCGAVCCVGRRVMLPAGSSGFFGEARAVVPVPLIANCLVAGCVVGLLPWTLRPLNREFHPVLQAVQWVNLHAEPDDVVLSNSPYAPFYAHRRVALLRSSDARMR